MDSVMKCIGVQEPDYKHRLDGGSCALFPILHLFTSYGEDSGKIAEVVANYCGFYGVVCWQDDQSETAISCCFRWAMKLGRGL